MTRLRFYALVTLTVLLSACTQVDEQPESTGGSEQPTDPIKPDSEQEPGLPNNEFSFRTPMTARDCQKHNGFVVGDIGDGRIHRDDYLCLNGEPPIGVIVPIEEAPVDIEGAVCCGTE